MVVLLAVGMLISGCQSWHPTAPSEAQRRELGRVAVVLRNQDVRLQSGAYPDQINIGEGQFLAEVIVNPSAVILLPVVLLIALPFYIYNESQKPKGAEARRVKEDNLTIQQAFGRLDASDHLRQAVETRIRELGDVRLLPLWLGEGERLRDAGYAKVAERGINTLVEVDLKEVWCHGEIGDEVALTMLSSVRVLRVRDRKTLYSASLSFGDPGCDRKFRDWARSGGAAFAIQLRRGLDETATTFVEEIFRRYEPNARAGQ